MGQTTPIRPTSAGPMSPLEVAAYRRRIEDQIEQLIATLDELDGDTDLEPTMGGVNPFYGDEAEPDADDETSLGWTAAGTYGKPPIPHQEDCELDTSDEEPSLGWTISGAVTAGTGDREDDECSGFADADALASEDLDSASFRSSITPAQRDEIQAIAKRVRHVTCGVYRPTEPLTFLEPGKARWMPF